MGEIRLDYLSKNLAPRAKQRLVKEAERARQSGRRIPSTSRGRLTQCYDTLRQLSLSHETIAAIMRDSLGLRFPSAALEMVCLTLPKDELPEALGGSKKALPTPQAQEDSVGDGGKAEALRDTVGVRAAGSGLAGSVTGPLPETLDKGREAAATAGPTADADMSRQHHSTTGENHVVETSEDHAAEAPSSATATTAAVHHETQHQLASSKSIANTQQPQSPPRPPPHEPKATPKAKADDDEVAAKRWVLQYMAQDSSGDESGREDDPLANAPLVPWGEQAQAAPRAIDPTEEYMRCRIALNVAIEAAAEAKRSGDKKSKAKRSAEVKSLRADMAELERMKGFDASVKKAPLPGGSSERPQRPAATDEEKRPVPRAPDVELPPGIENDTSVSVFDLFDSSGGAEAEAAEVNSETGPEPELVDLTAKSWTGAQPVDLLAQWCRKHVDGKHPPKYIKDKSVALPGRHRFTLIVERILADDGGKEHRAVRCTPQQITATARDARNLAALVGLFSLAPELNVRVQLSPPCRVLWDAWQDEAKVAAQASRAAALVPRETLLDELQAQVERDFVASQSHGGAGLGQDAGVWHWDGVADGNDEEAEDGEVGGEAVNAGTDAEEPPESWDADSQGGDVHEAEPALEDWEAESGDEMSGGAGQEAAAGDAGVSSPGSKAPDDWDADSDDETSEAERAGSTVETPPLSETAALRPVVVAPQTKEAPIPDPDTGVDDDEIEAEEAHLSGGGADVPALPQHNGITDEMRALYHTRNAAQKTRWELMLPVTLFTSFLVLSLLFLDS